MQRKRLMALASVVSILGALIAAQAAPAEAGADDTGSFSPAFSPNGEFNAAPPSSVAESVKYPTAVSDVALPNGRFVYWNGLENLETTSYPLPVNAADVSQGHASRSRQLTIGAGDVASWKTPLPEGGGGGDMFCSDQRILLDGTVLDVGGTIWKNDPVNLENLSGGAYTGQPGGTTELFGNNAARIYNSEGNSNGGTWTQVTNRDTGEFNYMKYGRWYPALVTLPNGQLLVSGGVGRLLYNGTVDTENMNNSGVVNVRESETFNPYTSSGDYDALHGTWTPNGDNVSLPLFPRLHVIADGKVFWGSNGQMWGPFGQAQDQALWNVMKFYNPATKSWSDAGLAKFGARSGASEVMLPFKPDSSGNYTTTNILQAGGVLGTSPGTFLAQKLTTVTTIDGSDNVTQTQVGDLNNSRWYSSSVIGPDGNVYVFNGADKDEVVCGGCETAVRYAEMYDTTNKTWVQLAKSGRERTYHNSAILMSDGRILVGGHSPINTNYGPGQSGPYGQDPVTYTYTNNDQHNTTKAVLGEDAATANNYKDPSFEIFDPPYRHRGTPPVLSSAPSSILGWGTTQTIVTPDAGTVDDAILVHMPATTHVTDADMRAIVLPTTNNGNGSVSVKIPTETGVAVPGFYYLFLRRTNTGYTQPSASNGAIVRVGDATVFQGAAATIAKANVGTLTSGSAPVAAKQGVPGLTTVSEPAAIGGRSAGRTESRSGSREPMIAGAIAALIAAAGTAMRRRRTTTA